MKPKHSLKRVEYVSSTQGRWQPLPCQIDLTPFPVIITSMRYRVMLTMGAGGELHDFESRDEAGDFAKSHNTVVLELRFSYVDPATPKEILPWGDSAWTHIAHPASSTPFVPGVPKDQVDRPFLLNENSMAADQSMRWDANKIPMLEVPPMEHVLIAMLRRLGNQAEFTTVEISRAAKAEYELVANGHTIRLRVRTDT